MVLIYVAQTNVIKHNFPGQQQGGVSTNKHKETYMFMYHQNGRQNLILKGKKGKTSESSKVKIITITNQNRIYKATSNLNSENTCYHSVQNLYFPTRVKQTHFTGVKKCTVLSLQKKELLCWLNMQNAIAVCYIERSKTCSSSDFVRLTNMHTKSQNIKKFLIKGILQTQ
jgi:hypothetical protein